MKKLILSILTVGLAAVAAFGQPEWKLNTDKEGIKVYTADFAGSKIKALKVEAEMEASPSQMVALLMDINSSTQWVYRLKSAKIIKQVSPSELYYYSEVNMPWPVNNRDFVAHLTVTQDPVTKVIVIDGPAVPGMMPAKQGIVRIDHSVGKWIITPVEGGRIRVQYTLHVEPGGSVPAWIVNMFAADGPLQVFRAIRTRLQMPAYRDAVLSYIDNGSKVYGNLVSAN